MIQNKNYALLFIFIFLCLVTGRAQADEFTFDYQKILTVEEPLQLDLAMFNGSITIVGEQTDRIIIEAVKTIRASNREEAEEVADHIEIKVRGDDHSVSVETNYLKMIERSESFWNKLLGTSETDSYGDVAYTIRVPVRTSLNFTSTNAEVTLSSLEGTIEIDNGTGNVQGEYLFGPVTVSQQSGIIDLQWVEGDIRIKSISSKIQINQIQGAIDLATLSGDVAVKTELDSHKSYFIETTSGYVSFSIPTDAAGRLNIETATGRIRTDVPLAITSSSRRHQVCEFGQDGPKINISTSTGDVEVSVY